MGDILKLRELLSGGYGVETIKEDAAGNCVIVLRFPGVSMPTEGEIYYFVTKDEAVKRKAREISDKFHISLKINLYTFIFSSMLYPCKK